MLLLRMLNSPFCFLKTVGHINKAFSKMTIALPASVSVRACTKLSFTSKGVYNSRRRLLSCKPVACAQDMANQSYPQTVNLDEGKARAAEIQSEQSKAQGGVTTPTDEASKARSAASQSQHVVNILTSGDPVNAEDVSQLAQSEAANSGTGQVAKGGPAAKAQGAMSQLKQVADEKVATKDVINQKDAAKIASAEAKLYDGQTPGNSVASKAQSAADKAKQAGLVPEQ